jgi:hypothetical protein
MESRGATARKSARIRSGRIGHALLSIAFLLPATNCLRLAAISATSFGRCTPLGATLRATRLSTVSADLRSATAPMATG